MKTLDFRGFVGQKVDAKPEPSHTEYIAVSGVLGLIECIPHSHRYRVTDTGLSTAMFISAVHDRLLPTGMADLEAPLPTRLRAATRPY